MYCYLLVVVGIEFDVIGWVVGFEVVVVVLWFVEVGYYVYVVGVVG